MNMEGELKHISHEHPLFSFEASERQSSIICNGCGKGLYGSCYICGTCYPSIFVLHKSCAEVAHSHEVQHPIHDKHPLIICKTPPYDKETCTCNICGEPCMRFIVYHCPLCKIYVHFKCLSLPLSIEKHPIHDKHPLIIFKTPPYDKETCTCNICGEPCMGFIVYHCPLCKIYVHFKCLSLPLSIESEIHYHPLTLFRKFITFICDFCGKEGKTLTYLCNVSFCGFWAHHNCASLPRMVKHMRHKHPLILTNSIKDDHSEHRVCQLCVKHIDTNHGVYYCSSCDYVAHLDCATDEKGIDENFMWESKGKEPTESTNMLEYEDSELDELINELSYIVKKTKVREDKIKVPIEIKRLYHEHDLQLIDKLDNYKICDGCVRLIFPPFYSCTQCSFVLHKFCAELPHIKRHPLHKHPLTLIKRPFPFFCNACGYTSTGFSYNCHECDFDFDVSCSLISELDKLIHTGHMHPLIFSSTTNDEECSACNSKGKIFRCTICEFTLDFGCATLPHTIKYKRHEHQFTLSYIAEDDSGEYYCDICEEERDPKHWFYYCEECNYPAHHKCIFEEFLYYNQGDHRNIKFGNTYKSSIHQHPLTLVQETKDASHCDKCGRLCKDIAFACATCNISFDWQCVHQYALSKQKMR